MADYYGGGGFMNDGYNQGGGAAASGSGAKKEKGGTSSAAIIPVTIKQLLTGANVVNGQCQIDGYDVSYARVVGRLTDIQDDMAKMIFSVTDGTETFNSFLWRDQSDTFLGSLRANMNIGIYVTLIVKVSPGDNNSARLETTNIKLVYDPNYITYHQLSAISTHLSMTRAPKNKLAKPAPGAAAAAPFQQPYGAAGGFVSPGQAAQSAFASSSGYGMGHSVMGGQGGSEHDKIRAIIAGLQGGVDPGTGVGLDDIWVQCQSQNVCSLATLREALSTMCMDGTLFTCSDEEHYMLST